MPAATTQRLARVRLIGFAVALVLEAALVATDIATSGTVIFTSAYLIAPLALALVAGPAIVAATAALSILLALASGLWNDFFLSADHIMRCSHRVARGAARAAQRPRA